MSRVIGGLLAAWIVLGALIGSVAGTVAAPKPAASAAPPPATAPTSRPSRRRGVVTAPPPPAAPNLLPGLTAQNTALQKIHDIYARDYADTSFTGRRTLALRLIDAADQTKKETDAKYVLLREARDLATTAGDVTTAFDAVDRLVETFSLVRLHERVDVLKAAVPSLSSVQTDLAAASICMDLADQCVVEGDYERTDALLSLASDAAQRAKSVPYYNWIETRAATVRPLKEAYDHAKPFEKLLASKPDDPQANLEMGKFVAFVKGDFDAGLNMLFKGSDKELAKLADEDLEATIDRPQSLLNTAGHWWDLAQTNQTAGDTRAAAAMRSRAEFWYRRAIPALDGLDKALAQRRLQELCPPPKPGATTKPLVARPPDTLQLINRHWYRVSIAEASWDTAQHLSQDAGGQLVSINTRAEGDLMIKLARGRALWLGASYDPAAGNWNWLSGNEMFYTNWLSGEPASLTSESHPQMSPTGAWRTATGKAGFISEWVE